MKLRDIIIFLLVTLYAIELHASDQSNILVFNLNSAVRYALKHSPSLDAERRSLAISKLNLKNSLATFAPNADVTSTHSMSKQEGSVSEKSSSLGFSLTQNLYNNGQDIANYKINKLQYQIQKTTYELNRDQLIKTVATNFLDLSLQRKLYDIQKANLVTIDKEYKSALKKYRAGLKTQKDVVRFRNRIQRLDISLLQAKNNIAQAKKQLLTSMGYDLINRPATHIKIKTTNLPEINISSVPTIEPILKEQPQYKTFLLQKGVDSLNVYLAKRKNWPEVTLAVNASYGNAGEKGFLGAIENRKTWDAIASLELRYNIFDAGTSSRNVNIAEEEQQQSKNNLFNQLLSIKQTLDNLMFNLQQNKLSYQLSNKLKDSELKNYQTMRKMYRNGKISYLDLSTSIDDLYSAQTEYVTDRYTLEKNLYSYYQYKGIINEKI